MGIKNFSQTFKAVRTVTASDYRGKTISIDAMTELFRASLGAKSVSTLTDKSGNPTMHISVILAVVFDFQRNGVDQIWVFDHEQNPDEDFHNPMKMEELANRKKKRMEAQAKLDLLKSVEDKPTFSDDEDDVDHRIKHDEEDKHDDKHESKTSDHQDQIDDLEKRTFTLSPAAKNDIKLIFNFLNIRWTEAPAGYEGECVATHLNIAGLSDAVFSGDTDPIAYGAKVLLRRNPRDKLIYEYTQENILSQIAEVNDNVEHNLNTIRSIALALGTDACKKTPKIGPKTVLKKIDEIEFTECQEKARTEFEKSLDITKLVIRNAEKTPFVNCMSEQLINWLVDEKSFNRARIQKMLTKGMASEKPKKPKKNVGTAKVKVEAEPDTVCRVIRKKKPVEN